MNFSLFLLLLLAFIVTVSANWTVLHSGKAVVPANVYQIQLRQRQNLTVKLSTNDTDQINIYLYEKGEQMMEQSKKKKSFYSSTSPLTFSYSNLIYNKYYIIVNLTTNTKQNKLRSYKLQLSSTRINYTYQGLYFSPQPLGMPVIVPYNSLSLKNTSFRYNTAFKQSTYYSMVVVYSYGDGKYKKQNIVTENKILSSNYCVNIKKEPQYILLVIKDFVSIADQIRKFSYKLEYFGNHTGCQVKCPVNNFWDDKIEQCTNVRTNNQQKKQNSTSHNAQININTSETINLNQQPILNITNITHHISIQNPPAGNEDHISDQKASVKNADEDKKPKDHQGQQVKKTNVSLILSIILPIIFFLILLAIFCYCYRRKKAHKIQQNLGNINQLNEGKDNPDHLSKSERNLRIRVKDMCSICENYQCDTILACGHNFHNNCIQQQVQKNKQCPLCESKVSKIIPYSPTS